MKHYIVLHIQILHTPIICASDLQYKETALRKVK